MENNKDKNGFRSKQFSEEDKKKNGQFHQSYREEAASEMTHFNEEDVEHDTELKSVYGWAAILISVLSFFFLPLIFAATSIILGVIARNRDAKTLGNTAIVFAIVSVLFRLLILPLI